MEFQSTRRNHPLKQRIAELEEQISILSQPRNGRKGKDDWKMPGKWRRNLKKTEKKINRNKILFIFMRKNGVVEEPQLVNYKDNVLTYNNKAYEIEPRAVWKWGKWPVYFYKEMDRRPVSNLNYKAIMERGDLTDSDEILLKATMRAIQDGQRKPVNKGAIVVGIIVLVAVIAAMTMFGNQPPTP